MAGENACGLARNGRGRGVTGAVIGARHFRSSTSPFTGAIFGFIAGAASGMLLNNAYEHSPAGKQDHSLPDYSYSPQTVARANIEWFDRNGDGDGTLQRDELATYIADKADKNGDTAITSGELSSFEDNYPYAETGD